MSDKVPPPGVYSMDYDAYAAIPAMNASRLERGYGKSLLHIQAGLPLKDGKAFKMGRAIHEAVLEPTLFAAGAGTKYATKPRGMDLTTKEGRAWKAQNPGRIIFSDDEWTDILEVSQACAVHPIAGPLLAEGKPEQTLIATYLDCQPLKARVDWLGDRYMVDLKTTTDATEQAFLRSVLDLGYHRKAAFYLNVANALGLDISDFYFIAVEKEQPHGIMVYRLEKSLVALGNREIVKLLDQYTAARKSNHFPCYPETITDLALPEYLAKRYGI